MEFLSLAASNEWLIKKKIHDENHKTMVNNYQLFKEYWIPKDAGRKAALSKRITNLICVKTDTILLITEYGIWPSCENWDLFFGFRKSLGEEAEVRQKPGQIFNKNDIVKFDSFLTLVLYFYWGAIIADSNQSYFINISHDENIQFFYNRGEIDFNELESFGLEEIKK